MITVKQLRNVSVSERSGDAELHGEFLFHYHDDSYCYGYSGLYKWRSVKCLFSYCCHVDWSLHSLICYLCVMFQAYVPLQILIFSSAKSLTEGGKCSSEPGAFLLA